MIKLLNQIEYIPKNWGSEQIIANNDKYCGKILFFVKGHRASLHYHKLKSESFYVLDGKILLLHSKNYELLEKNKDDVAKIIEFAEYKNVEDRYQLKILDCKYGINYEYLNVGDVFHLDPYHVHQAIGLLDSKIIEFSTHSDDSDSYRIICGN